MAATPAQKAQSQLVGILAGQRLGPAGHALREAPSYERQGPRTAPDIGRGVRKGL